MIKIIALTETGKQTAKRLFSVYSDAELLFKPQPFAETVQNSFKQGDTLIMICATGIVVRTLAGVIQDKQSDPPVLVLDEVGQFVIPLLSGHQGGANQLAQELADQLGAQCVITTANAYTKPVYTVGMGCEKGCLESELASLLDSCLQQAGLSIKQVDSINSINIKADETGLIDLARSLYKPFQTWSVEQLRQVEAQMSEKSDYVFSVVGVYGVAEPAALYAAQTLSNQPAELVLSKQKTAKATCAIARSFQSRINT